MASQQSNSRDMQEDGLGLSGGTVNGNVAINGTLTQTGLWYLGANATSDTAALQCSGRAQNAYSQAAVNTAGAPVMICGGIGKRIITVSNTGAATAVFYRFNATAVTLTSAVAPANENEYARGASAAATASNLAACINAHSVLSLEMTATAPAAVVYITPKSTIPALQLAATGDNSAAGGGNDGGVILGGIGVYICAYSTGSTAATAYTSSNCLQSASNNLYVRSGATAASLGGAFFGYPVLASSTTPVTVTAVTSNYTHTNEGATALGVHNLPTAVAGYRFTFYVQDSDGIKVVAAAGDTIRIGGSVSGAAGYCQSTTIGDCVTLQSINATEWVAVSVVGAGWTVV